MKPESVFPNVEHQEQLINKLYGYIAVCFFQLTLNGFYIIDLLLKTNKFPNAWKLGQQIKKGCTQ